MVLLLKATEFAKKGSGKFGEAVMATAKLAGGLALGGVALGTAFAGRTVVARTAAYASRRPDAITHAKAQFDYDKWERGGRRGPAPVVPRAPINPLDRLGSRINISQLRSGEVAHARTEMDELKKKTGVEGLDDKFLSGIDQTRMENEYVKSNRSEIETSIRKGYDSKGKEVVWKNPATGLDEDVESEGELMARERPLLETRERGAGHVTATGELTKEAEARINNELKIALDIHLKDFGEKIGKQKYETLQHESKEKVGMGTRVIARSTSGTYDPRNLANMKTDKREGLSTKATVGLITAVALGMRLGLKQGAGVNAGTPQRDVFKDIGDTVTNALKSAKIGVDLNVGDRGLRGDSHGTSGGEHH